MLVGVPTEIKQNEYRVALTPAGAEALTLAGQRVLIQTGAGENSGFTDDFYEQAGAEIAADAEEVWARSDMVMKVKDPIAPEWPLMREDQIVFCYFHFAASETLTRAVMESGAVAIAYETVGPERGSLPLLTPMSEVAGRMSIQAGAKYLERPHGGSGILLGGVPGVLPAKVLVLGGGVVGTHAAKMAAGLGARVSIMDISLARLRQLADIVPANVNVLYSTRYAVRKQLRDTDLVVGAVLVPGARAPSLVAREDLSTMRRGSVIVDVAVDQGGCVETIRPTTHEDPVYEVDGVIHYGVTNMPGAVPRTSTLALTNATLPYALQVACKGWRRACEEDHCFAPGINIVGGRIVHPGVADAFGMACESLDGAMPRAASASASSVSRRTPTWPCRPGRPGARPDTTFAAAKSSSSLPGMCARPVRGWSWSSPTGSSARCGRGRDLRHGTASPFPTAPARSTRTTGANSGSSCRIWVPKPSRSGAATALRNWSSTGAWRRWWRRPPRSRQPDAVTGGLAARA